MPYIGNSLATQFQAFATQTITGDGSTGYTLDRAVTNGKELLVYINNVKQEEGSGKSYTATGTTITFSAAVTSDDSCYLVYLGSAVQTVNPSDASVGSAQITNDTLVMPNKLDMNGNELILDADADTSITADTDDQIDIRVGGNDQIKITTSEIAFNENGADTNVRIESDTNANFVVFDAGQDSGAGRMFIGTTNQMGGRINCESYGIAVGEGASPNEFRRMYWHTTNDQLQFWNGSNEPVINSSGVFTDVSDEKLKKDIADITYGIDTVKALKPRKYKMKATNKEEIGFIAQEVEPHIPEVVGTGTNPDGVERKNLAYQQLTAVLTKALQEAIAKIETLETKVKALEEK
tara:strand:- start:303 stop:1352 length:1050 start_codon:yes stop_codon:yes gene_type:complete